MSAKPPFCKRFEMSDTAKNWIKKAAEMVGYDVTHITRIVPYREVENWLADQNYEQWDALEISAGWKWWDTDWKSYSEMNWPD